MKKECTLRQFLKNKTASLHGKLDALITPLATGDAADYTRFLVVQYRARLPIERLISALNRPNSPPEQTPLIVADLASLNWPMPPAAHPFALPENAHPIGLYWVLAGSSLGNRMLLRRVQAANPALPTQFLADGLMAAYWKHLKPQLDAQLRSEDAAHALAAAKATFDHFLAAAHREIDRQAA